MFSKKSTRMAATLLALAMVLPVISAVSPVPADAAQGIEMAAYQSYGVRVNGVALTQDPMLTQIEGQTYVAIRPVAQALDSQVQTMWDGNTATFVHWGLVSLVAVPGMNYVVANDRYLYVPNRVQAMNGNILIPLDTLCKVFDATCVAQPDGSIDLTTGSGALAYASQFYSSEDLYWLSHIINAESGNQPLTGKIAVGNVVLNRVKDGRFPNSVKSVVCQRGQFTPVANGTINKTPNAESVLAAKLCLDGAVALDGVLYFNQASLRCWAARNRTYVATIGGHAFFK